MPKRSGFGGALSIGGLQPCIATLWRKSGWEMSGMAERTSLPALKLMKC